MQEILLYDTNDILSFMLLCCFCHSVTRIFKKFSSGSGFCLRWWNLYLSHCQWALHSSQPEQSRLQFVSDLWHSSRHGLRWAKMMGINARFVFRFTPMWQWCVVVSNLLLLLLLLRLFPSTHFSFLLRSDILIHLFSQWDRSIHWKSPHCTVPHIVSTLDTVTSGGLTKERLAHKTKA